jgi:hypothetical protein
VIAMMEVIKTRSNGARTDASPITDADRLYERIRKLIPAEVIAGYVAIAAIISAVSPNSFAIFFALVGGVAATIVSLLRAGTHREPPILQYAFSSLTFLAWAFTIRDPLQVFGITTPDVIPAACCVIVPVFGAYFIDVVEN